MAGNGSAQSGIGWPEPDLADVRAQVARHGGPQRPDGALLISPAVRSAASYEAGVGWPDPALAPAAEGRRQWPGSQTPETAPEEHRQAAAARADWPQGIQGEAVASGGVSRETARTGAPGLRHDAGWRRFAPGRGNGGRQSGSTTAESGFVGEQQAAWLAYEAGRAAAVAGPNPALPRHGKPLGWLDLQGQWSYGTESGGRDGTETPARAWEPEGGEAIPGSRTSHGPTGHMIASTYPGAMSARGESEDTVAIPVAPDASADTPIARAAQAAMKARTGRDQWPRPRGCRILTIANQKGGVGKTTTAVNLAASLAMHGSRVLVVDLDPQGNASTALDVEHRSGHPSIYNVLVDGLPLADVVLKVQGFPHLYCAPATIDLAGAEIELVPLVAREARLSRAVQEFDSSGLDYIFIDCPPSLGLLTVNALVAAPEVLIPIQCEYYALEGLEQLLRTVDLVKSHLNPKLSVSTILLTMFDSRTRLASQVADEVRGHFGDLVLGSVIPRSVRVSEAPSYGQSVMTYDPGSSGALAYLDAAREMAFKNQQAAKA
jgi:chromosome partitioning protein